jgi:hypothetical protein
MPMVILGLSSFRNGSHLPTTQCACADFVDFATQRNGGRGCEKDLLTTLVTFPHIYLEQINLDKSKTIRISLRNTTFVFVNHVSKS